MGVMGATPPAAQIEQYAATLRRRTGKAAARRGERGAAISADLFPALERYRGFRHVVRNVYAYVLDPRLMAVLISDLPETVACVRVKLAGFADGLDAIAQAAGA